MRKLISSILMTVDGYIDEYRFLLNPVVLGGGTRFFPDGFNMSLRLVDSKRFASGNVALTYRREDERRRTADGTRNT